MKNDAHMKQLSLATFIAILVCTQPVFLLVAKGWGNGILIIASLLSLILIIARKLREKVNRKPLTRTELWFIGAFLMPVVATFIPALLREDHYWAQYDSPSKFLLAILVYLGLRDTISPLEKYLRISIPLGILFAFIYQWHSIGIHPSSSLRANTYFMDAIMFGYISLSLGLMALYTAAIHRENKKYVVIINSLAGAAGVYLSFLSQSRTGWLSIIFVIGLYAAQFGKSTLITSRAKLLLPIILIITALLPAIPTVKSRIGTVVTELSSYTFTGVAPETSIGLRITYWRIAAEMFTQKPFAGYGDTAKTGPELPENAKRYSSDYVRSTIFQVGFHNEFAATTVRSGLLGAISIIGVFFVPLIIFLKNIRSQDQDIKTSAALGAVLVLVVATSSLTIETFGLKFAASYYACMIAIFILGVLRPKNSTSLNR